MPWTPPATLAVGHFVDANDWNNYITENLKAIVATCPTTVTDLNTQWGTTPDGAIGRVKVGSTPFDFIDLRYDIALAKWVSVERWYLLQTGTWNVTGQALSTDVVVGSGLPLMLIPWKTYDTAGLQPQAKITGLIRSDATGTAGARSATPIIYTANLNDTAVGANALNAASGITAITATATVLASAWAGFTGTVTDFLSPAVVMNQAGSGSAQFTVSSLMYGLRWVG